MTREKLIDELNNRIGFDTDNERYAMSEYEKEFYRSILNALEREPKTGHWIQDNNTFYNYCKCSVCGKGDTYMKYNYCPNCGSRMKSEIKQ